MTYWIGLVMLLTETFSFLEKTTFNFHVDIQRISNLNLERPQHSQKFEYVHLADTLDVSTNLCKMYQLPKL